MIRAEKARRANLWKLLPGPQTEAANTPAFETLYGGQAGGGKSELITWLARYRHKKSLLIRTSFPDLKRTLIQRSLERYGDPKRFNISDKMWRFSEERRIIEFGYLESERDVYQYQGAEYDLFAPDELTHYTRNAYLYIFSRVRSTYPGQRERIVATANPGGENEAWVIERWAAWLQPNHPNPAKSGEIRWYRRLDEDREIETTEDDPDAKSRTFIRAGLKDNPYLSESYRQSLNMLPEPYRSQLRDGDWSAGSNDSAYQIIPTAWVAAAQERWLTAQRPKGPMTALGLDVARGGQDKTVASPRYANWFAEQISFPGKATPDGFAVAEQIAMLGEHGHPVGDKTVVNIDVVGVGTSPFDILRGYGFNVVPLNGAEGTDAKDIGGNLGFVNLRAEMWWKLREALDPNSGQDLALPNDPELRADLTAPRWKATARGIQVEAKDDVKKRIGRSPDKGDSLVYAHAIKTIPGYGVVQFYDSFLQGLKRA